MSEEYRVNAAHLALYPQVRVFYFVQGTENKARQALRFFSGRVRGRGDSGGASASLRTWRVVHTNATSSQGLRHFSHTTGKVCILSCGILMAMSTSLAM